MSPTGAAGRAGFAALVGLMGLGASPPADLRTDLEAIGLALDRAVLQVSRPSRTAPRGMARGYRLEGFGAMFVVAPRALPVPPPASTPEEREIAQALSLAAQELEQRLPRVLSDDVRLQLQQSLKAMRQTEAELRLRDNMGRRAAGLPPETEGREEPAAPRTLEQQLQDLERDVQMMQRMQSEAVQSVTSDSLGLPPEMRREIEASMRFFNQQAEAFAAEAERARQEAERALWNRLGQQPPEPSAAGTPATASPRPPDEASPAVPPPWQLWIDPLDDATPDPQAVIQGVGDAVTSVLETQGARLRVLAPQEMVAVAIDFVPATRAGMRARPARTLMVRVKKADIDQRAAGQISPAEFRKRVERVEY
jgi:hypothetical protein